MRPFLIALTALLVLPAAAPADRADCYPRGSETVVRSKVARVYSMPFQGIERQVFGCLYSRGKRFALDNPDTRAGQTYETAFGPFRIAGRYALYQWQWSPPEPMEYRAPTLTLTNLSTGGGVRTDVVWSGDVGNANDESPEGAVVRSVLRANGSAAWTSWSVMTHRQPEVWVLLGRRARMIDSGDDVKARSLRLVGRRITWTKAGERRSAPLR